MIGVLLEDVIKDAQRYRFLRDQIGDNKFERRVVVTVEDWDKNLGADKSFGVWSSKELFGNDIDNEIDLAMKREYDEKSS